MSNTLVETLADETSAMVEPLTVEQYHAMLRTGVILEGAPIELIDGLLVRKDRRVGGGSIMTVGPRHASTVTRIAGLLQAIAKPLGLHCRTQQPVTLDNSNEPEPDVSLAMGAAEDYANRHPHAVQVPLIVEVADSSLAFDCGRKLQTYAASEIPLYIVVNLRDDVVSVYRDPSPDRQEYTSCEVLRPGQVLEVTIVGRVVSMPVAGLLGL
jgi:Uma2 family endonuclease